MSFISKTFGGLSLSYLIRQYIFGAIIGGFFIYITTLKTSFSVVEIFIPIVLTLLYPYSRFVYETIVEYIFGNNIFFVTIPLLLLLKLLTMFLCWTFSVFIAPFGLLYLYFYHTRNEKNEEEQ